MLPIFEDHVSLDKLLYHAHDLPSRVFCSFGLAPGMYTCKILKDDEVLLTTPVLMR